MTDRPDIFQQTAARITDAFSAARDEEAENLQQFEMAAEHLSSIVGDVLEAGVENITLTYGDIATLNASNLVRDAGSDSAETYFILGIHQARFVLRLTANSTIVDLHADNLAKGAPNDGYVDDDKFWHRSEGGETVPAYLQYQLHLGEDRQSLAILIAETAGVCVAENGMKKYNVGGAEPVVSLSKKTMTGGLAQG